MKTDESYRTDLLCKMMSNETSARWADDDIEKTRVKAMKSTEGRCVAENIKNVKTVTDSID